MSLGLFVNFNLLSVALITRMFPSLVANVSVNWFGQSDISVFMGVINILAIIDGTVTRGNSVFEFVRYLSNSSLLSFSSCLDLVVVDLVSTYNSFTLRYILNSVATNNVVSILVDLTFSLSKIPSLITMYPSLNWLESEAGEMFGIQFLTHPCFNPLLLDVGFSGYPLSKLYPVSGFSELFFSQHLGRLTYLDNS